MKQAKIVYYSYSGNTAKVADVLKEVLEKDYQMHITALQAENESATFFGQAMRAFFKKQASLKADTEFDLSAYDLVAIGSPVWAFACAPAVRTFLKKCHGLAGKSIILFVTYGSGAGKGKCVKEMELILKEKGISSSRVFFIQQFRVDNRELVREKIEAAIKR